MKLEDVIKNMDNTILGKELLLKRYKENLKVASFGESIGLSQIIEMLQLNVDELKRIQYDLKSIDNES